MNFPYALVEHAAKQLMNCYSGQSGNDEGPRKPTNSLRLGAYDAFVILHSNRYSESNEGGGSCCPPNDLMPLNLVPEPVEER